MEQERGRVGEGFDTWLDDLQLYLLSDSKDSVSLFDLALSDAPAPLAIADSATRSQWLTCDAAARLAIRNHLPLAECAHFGQHRIAQALYAAVVAHYSSPTTAALGRLLLPYLFPELNQPPMFITLYFIVTRLPDSLRPVRDHFLSLDPTSLTVDLLKQHLLVAETSAVATSLFLKTSGLLLLVQSDAAARARVVEVAAGEEVGAAVEVVAAVVRVGALVAAVEAAVGVAAMAALGLVAVGLALDVLVLVVASVSSSSVGARPSRPSSFVSGFCVGRLGVVVHLLRSRIAIFDLDFDAILSAMYALSVSAECDCYRCVPPDPGIAATALGTSESGTLPGTAPAQALHTFTLDSGASACFFRDSTTLTPLSTPVPVRLADPFGGPVVARSSTVLRCLAVPFGSLSAASCLCHLLSHQTLLWHHRLGHPSLPRLRGMHYRLLDITFDELVPFYRLFPYRSDPPLASPLFLAPGPPLVDPLPPQGPTPSSVSQVDPLPGPAPVQVAVGSGAAGGAASGGAESEGAGSRGAEPGGQDPVGAEPVGVEPEGAEPGGIESEGAESGGAVPGGSTSFGGPTAASPQLSPQQLLEWFVWRPRLRSAGVAGAGVVDLGVGGAGDSVRPRPYFPASPLPAPSPYTELSGGLTERGEPVSRPVSPVRTAHRVLCSRPPPVPGTHAMALRPSSVPLRVPLPAPLESSLHEVPGPASGRACAASPTVTRLLTTAVTEPSFESAAASALVAELLDFAAA
ncbi:unnamed protein product [Closterium sp. NIES-53]